jgi:hypothetical protein
MRRTPLPLFLAVAVLTLRVATSAADDVTVSLKGDVAFAEGATEYKIGMSAGDFEKAFGPPEKKEAGGNDGSRQWIYKSDGLYAMFGPDNRLKLVQFFAGRVKTDGDITLASSIRQVVEVHGQPTDRTEQRYEDVPALNQKGFTIVQLKYKLGERWVIFHFKDGKMGAILVSRDRNWP